MFRDIFTFSGRMNRKPYWIKTLFVVLAMLIPSFVIIPVLEFTVPFYATVSIIGVMAVPIILALIASISIGVRRLHDRNKGWWWFSFFYILPIGFQLIALWIGESEPIGVAINGLGTMISIWVLIELGFLKGTEGSNAYGEDPLMAGLADPHTFD